MVTKFWSYIFPDHETEYLLCMESYLCSWQIDFAELFTKSNLKIESWRILALLIVLAINLKHFSLINIKNELIRQKKMEKEKSLLEQRTSKICRTNEEVAWVSKSN